MTREQARNLLMLPKKASREQIDEHYQLLREFYFPPIYELNYKRVPEKVKQWLYREKRGGFYEGTNGVNYLELPDDPGFVAFTLYTKICEAYECLTDEKNQNKYDVDPNTAFGKDTLRFGPVIGWIKRIISAMVKKAHWLLLAIIVTAIVWFMIAPLRDFFLCVGDVLSYAYVALWIAGFLVAPIDNLLLIPKRIYFGFMAGLECSNIFTKFLGIIFFSIFGAIGGIISFVFKPGAAQEDREIRLSGSSKGKKEAAEEADALYEQMRDNMRQILDEKIKIYNQAIRDLRYYQKLYGDDTWYMLAEEREKLFKRKPLFEAEYQRCEEMAEEEYEEIEQAEARNERTLEKAGKYYDFRTNTVGFGAESSFEIAYEMQDASDDYDEALKEHRKTGAELEARRREEDRWMDAIKYRVSLETVLCMRQAELEEQEELEKLCEEE